MNCQLTSKVLAGVLMLFTTGCTTEREQPLPRASLDQETEWNLVWSDEFAGDRVDSTKWSFQIGDGCDINLCGWGNNELQWYSGENASVADGRLTILASDSPEGEHRYTSSRMRSLNKGDWKYGKIEVRASLPTSQGLWPAIWMMPSENRYGSWAASGEIDIMEALGHQPDRVYGTLHYGDRWPDNTMSGDTLFFDDSAIAEFHTYTIQWQEGRIRWFVDGAMYGEQSNWFTEGHDFPAPFDQKFHLILNVAIGGDWPGNPDSTTVFPQTMIVDYVRVFKNSTAEN